MIVLIDASDSSLTVSWPEMQGALKYVLQYRTAVSSTTAEDDNAAFQTLSDKLTSTQARKRNLDASEGYFFRVGPLREGDEAPKTWVAHEEAFQLISSEQAQNRLAIPKVQPAGRNEALLVKWSKGDDDKTCEIQMRVNDGGADWMTIAPSFSGTEVVKKNLSSSKAYQFRVRPTAESTELPFSEASVAVAPLGLSKGIQSLFETLEGGKLLKDPQTSVSLADALGGKEFVLLYASAHWCGPCRQFTPMLSKWYQSQGAIKSAEVVFLSADHDEKGFQSYFASMPWLAVDYDDDTREQLMSYIRVTGIPRLVVLDGKTGRTLVDNGVGQPLDVQNWRRLAAGNGKGAASSSCGGPGGKCC